MLSTFNILLFGLGKIDKSQKQEGQDGPGSLT